MVVFREHVAAKSGSLDVAYWRDQLAGPIPVLELALDYLRPAHPAAARATATAALDSATVSAFERFCDRRAVTPFVTLLTAFNIMLLRYTGERDLVVGSIVPLRRTRPETGMRATTSNVVALRTKFVEDPPVLEAVAAVEKVVTTAVAHRDLPFDRVAAIAGTPGQPIFHTMFALLGDWECLGDEPVTRDDLAATAGYIQECDFVLWAERAPNGLRLTVDYAPTLFAPDTMQRLLKHFQTLLHGLVLQPEASIGSLPVLDDDERQQVLNTWNATARPYPEQLTIHQLFEAQVKRTPEAPAVIFDQQRISYDELNRQANQLAHFLMKRGVGPDTFVGVCVERSEMMVVAVLGILKAGAAYIPLDPAFPKERLGFMMEDSQMPVVLTQFELSNSLGAHRAQVIYLDADRTQIAAARDDNPEPRGSSMDLAYVLFTSGSTGRPKGVQIAHRSVVNFLCSMLVEPGFSEHDVLLAVTTLSFDIAALELYLPLIVGGTVAVVSHDVAIDGAELAKRIVTHGATVMQATPATWRLLLEAGWQGEQRLKILCGGEAMPEQLAAQLLPRCRELWNLYGPTETTIWSTVYRVMQPLSSIPIGRPIANTTVYLLDEALRPVPIGVPGELYIGGDGLARGYLNRPDLTAAKFIRNPFSLNPADRLYKTGDLARFLRDGNIKFVGRIDHQVKLFGFRIELGEIETALAHHPAVGENVVVVRSDRTAGDRLIGYVVARPGTQPGARELRQFLKQQLPEYMVPAAFVLLDRLPLTPNGKVDRRALPEPDWTASPRASTFVGPSSTLEHDLVRIWEQVLSYQPISVHDNFFDLGGHSLLAMRLSAQIEALLGQHLPLATLFKAPTIAELVRILRADEKMPAWTPVVPLQTGGTQPPLFCIPSAGNTAFDYLPLAKYLGPGQPVYGLQPRGLDTEDQVPETLEQIAADYVTAIKKVQSQGPYLLAGTCFGGVVAFEMARQLTADGQHVALLAILDTVPPRPAERKVVSGPLDWLQFTLYQWQNRPISYIWQDFLAGESWRIAWRLKRQLRRRMPRAANNEQMRRARHVLNAHNAAEKHYRARPYGGAVCLVWSTEWVRATRRQRTRKAGWDAIVSDSNAQYEVNGRHAAILEEPAVQVLAAQLHACLATAVDAPHGMAGGEHG